MVPQGGLRLLPSADSVQLTFTNHQPLPLTLPRFGNLSIHTNQSADTTHFLSNLLPRLALGISWVGAEVPDLHEGSPAHLAGKPRITCLESSSCRLWVKTGMPRKPTSEFRLVRIGSQKDKPPGHADSIHQTWMSNQLSK